MRFELHARFTFSAIRNFNWPKDWGQVRIYRITGTTGYCLGFHREGTVMYVPAWLLHDIEARGVPLLGIRPAWFSNEVWWRFRQCFHTKETSSIIDHWISSGGTLSETGRRIYVRDDSTEDGIASPVPWFWHYFLACLVYHRKRLLKDFVTDK